MNRPKLTNIQKRRMASASGEALNKRQALHVAQIMGVSPAKLTQFALEMVKADNRFDQLVCSRGLIVGDTVRVIVESPYKGVEAPIAGIETTGATLVLELADGDTIVPLATEVELVEPKHGQDKNA